MRKITQEHAEKLIRQSNGSFFSVSFLKSDGSLRNMTCRTGVHSYTNGNGAAYDAKDYGLVTVFDVSKRDYRNVRLDTLERLAINGKEYTVI